MARLKVLYSYKPYFPQGSALGLGQLKAELYTAMSHAFDLGQSKDISKLRASESGHLVGSWVIICVCYNVTHSK
jgi:hypothetical protein